MTGESVMNGLLARIGHDLLRWGFRLPASGPFVRLYQKQRLIDLLDSLQINCVIDVGANRGLYAHSLRRLGFRGLILCFEPISEDYQQIIRIAAGDDAWKTFNCGVGSADTLIEFNMIRTGETTVFSSFLESTCCPKESVEKRTVPVRRLDSVLEEERVDIRDLRIF